MHRSSDVKFHRFPTFRTFSASLRRGGARARTASGGPWRGWGPCGRGTASPAAAVGRGAAAGSAAGAGGAAAWIRPRCTGTGRWRPGSRSAAGSTARWASAAAPAAAAWRAEFAVTPTDDQMIFQNFD